MQKMPLFQGSNLEVYVPELDFFMSKIENGESFSFVRFQIEYWRMVRLALRELGWPGWNKPTNMPLHDDKFIQDLGKQMVRSWNNKQSMGRPIKFIPEVFSDHMRMVINPKPEGFHLGVSDRAWYFGILPPEPIDKWSPWSAPLIKAFLPENEIPFQSIILRRWSNNGTIHQMFEKFKDHPTIILGPYYYKNFAKKLGLTNTKYINISLTEACLHLDSTLKDIERAHNELHNKFGKVFHLYAGGSAGAWLAIKLHEQLKNATIIEFGRALDVYFYYDKVKGEAPRWTWGGWMDLNQPKWIKLKYPKVII